MQLRPYQIEISDKAVCLLNFYKIAYLSMQVRTGKTLTAFETAKKYGAKKLLFVTKLKAIQSIKSDSKHYHGIDLTVINFESVNKATGEYDLIIIDEAHSLGAFPKPSKRAKKLKVICKNKPIIYLSGTPAPESHSQLYHQFYVSSFSPFAQYSNFYKWAADFVDVKKKKINGFDINDYHNAKPDMINKHTNHFFLAKTQLDAGFDVAIEEVILNVPLDDLQKTIISRLLSDKVVTGKSGEVILADTPVKLQSKIHQVCSGTVKAESGQILTISTTKAQYIKEYFKGLKIALFYKFIGEFEVLKNTFEDWTNDPEYFQKNGGTYLGQFVSSREGVRLDTADAIVFYNIDFSYLSYEQAKNRIISKEREKKAVLYWIFSNDKLSIEPKIHKAVLNKTDYTNYFFKKEYGIKGSKKTD